MVSFALYISPVKVCTESEYFLKKVDAATALIFLFHWKVDM